MPSPPRLDGEVDIQDYPGRADTAHPSRPSNSGTSARPAVGRLVTGLLLGVVEVQGYGGDSHPHSRPHSLPPSAAC